MDNLDIGNFISCEYIFNKEKKQYRHFSRDLAKEKGNIVLFHVNKLSNKEKTNVGIFHVN